MIDDPDDQIPDPLGQYELKAQIGFGGGGLVFESEQPELGEVAIKVLRPSLARDDDMHLRFIEEARKLRSLKLHDSVVIVHAVDVHLAEDEGGIDLPFILMELCVEGSIFDRITKKLRRRCTDDELLGLITLLASNLEALHRIGLVHRDIKPTNLLIRDTNQRRQEPVGELLRSNEQMILADFGLVHPAGPLPPDLQGQGTPAWGAPELFAPGPTINAATDVFSASIVAVWAATGERPRAVTEVGEYPFSDETLRAMGTMEAGLRRGLEYRQQDRQSSMDEWLTSLTEPRPSLRERLAKLTLVAAAVLVAVVAAVAATSGLPFTDDGGGELAAEEIPAEDAAAEPSGPGIGDTEAPTAEPDPGAVGGAIGFAGDKAVVTTAVGTSVAPQPQAPPAVVPATTTSAPTGSTATTRPPSTATTASTTSTSTTSTSTTSTSTTSASTTTSLAVGPDPADFPRPVTCSSGAQLTFWFTKPNGDHFGDGRNVYGCSDLTLRQPAAEGIGGDQAFLTFERCWAAGIEVDIGADGTVDFVNGGHDGVCDAPSSPVFTVGPDGALNITITASDPGGQNVAYHVAAIRA